MKNKMKLGMCSALLVGSLVGGGLGTGDSAAYASSNDINNKVAQNVAINQFNDVTKNHYAYDAIVWGKSKGLISGYTDTKGNPNGKFGPNDNVTEAQFVKMVTNYLGLKDTAGNITKNKGNNAHWADSDYDAMAKHGVPLNGYFDNKLRNTAMKRGTVAQALGYLLGEETSLKGSINFLLKQGVTSGQNPQYEGKDLFKFFGSSNNLSRAQVITFLHRMDSKKLTNLSTIADMTASDSNSLNAKAKEGYSYMDVSLGGSKPSTDNNSSGNNNSNNNNSGNVGNGNTDVTFNNDLLYNSVGTNVSKIIKDKKYDIDVRVSNGGALYTLVRPINSNSDIIIKFNLEANGNISSLSTNTVFLSNSQISSEIKSIMAGSVSLPTSYINGAKDDGKVANGFKVTITGNLYVMTRQ